MTTQSIRGDVYDAVIVGARCAGAATALLLARAGLKVLVVDRGREGTDTLSTHALMRSGVMQLDRWGLLDALKEAGTPPVRTTTFHYADEVVPIDIKPQAGVEALYAPRRTVLDRILVEGARASGAEVRHEVRLVELIRAEDGRVCGAVVDDAERRKTIRARIVIGADGMRSTTAKQTGADVVRSGEHTSAVVYAYWAGMDLEGYHWYYRPGVSAGSIQTNDGLTCLFAAMPPERFHREVQHGVAELYRRVIGECDPDLAERVDNALLVEKHRGFAGLVGYLRKSWGPGWALVGDAGYFKDPLTAHGITDALIDAELLALAVIEGGDEALARYQERRDERFGLFEVTDRVASFDWDLPTVQELHLWLAKEMKRETIALSELHRQLDES